MASRAARLPLPASVNTPDERVACPIPRNVPAATVPVTVTVPAPESAVACADASDRTPSVNQLTSRSATGPAPSWEAVTRSVPLAGVSSAFSSSKVSGKVITPPGRSARPPARGQPAAEWAWLRFPRVRWRTGRSPPPGHRQASDSGRSILPGRAQRQCHRPPGQQATRRPLPGSLLPVNRGGCSLCLAWYGCHHVSGAVSGGRVGRTASRAASSSRARAIQPENGRSGSPPTDSRPPMDSAEGSSSSRTRTRMSVTAQCWLPGGWPSTRELPGV